MVKKRKAPDGLETTEICLWQQAPIGGGKILVKFREEFELVGFVSLVERCFVLGFVLGCLLGFASKGFKPVYNFFTCNTFEGSVDGITVFNGSSANGDPNLGCFSRLIGYC